MNTVPSLVTYEYCALKLSTSLTQGNKPGEKKKVDVKYRNSISFLHSLKFFNTLDRIEFKKINDSDDLENGTICSWS